MLTLKAFEEAAEIVQRVAIETKLIYSDFFSEQTGNKVYLKPENLQKTGAYKLRGAYYKISTLTDEERAKGLITASAGNHAQGVAYAAQAYGCKATIVMPTTTPLMKVDRTKSYGAEVVLKGDVYDEAAEYALDLAREKGYTFIHPFDDPVVATGQGTIAMEIIKELPLVDYILVPVGGGGLSTGVSTLAKYLNPKIKVIGVEPAGAACLKASFKAGKVTTLEHVSTIADGYRRQDAGQQYLPLSEEESGRHHHRRGRRADRGLPRHGRKPQAGGGKFRAADGGGAQASRRQGKKIVSILSGGNMDIITMSSVVQLGLIKRDRIFTVSVMLPDKPGELVRVASVIAGSQGNVVKLEHNQFVSTNRTAAVELKITIEAFGTAHKHSICRALEEEGYKPQQISVLM